MTVKIALSGIGEIARAQHIPAITAAPEWELAAAVSRNSRVDGAAGYFTDTKEGVIRRTAVDPAASLPKVESEPFLTADMLPRDGSFDGSVVDQRACCGTRLGEAAPSPVLRPTAALLRSLIFRPVRCRARVSSARGSTACW